jgi:putative transport protein
MLTLFAEEMLVLFAILVIGSWIGQITVRGINLGSVGVLFTAMVFGHFQYGVPQAVTELGLLLFVYAVGLQAGPRFFRSFQRNGLQAIIIAAAMVSAGALAIIGVTIWFDLPYQLAAGLFTGALTNTPALAAAIGAIERVASGAAGEVSAGYGIAYPFAMVSVVLLVQFLPRLLRRDLHAEAQRWQVEHAAETPGLEARQYRITNPNCDGKMVRQVNPHRMSLVNISRIKRDGQVFAAMPDAILQLGDIVMVVGSADELEKMPLLLGEETHERMDVNANVLSVDVDVTEVSLTGKKLAQMRAWEQYTVVITRIRRQGLEITPTGNVSLELGDNIRVVGEKRAVEEFVKLVHGSPRRVDETNMLPFLTGLLLGILLGAIPINMPNGIELRLGSAGGAFIVSLLVGHFGGIGPLRLYVPNAARNLARELGLILFLAGAGINAGTQFTQILAEYGWRLLVGGALVTVVTVLTGLVLMYRVYRMNLLAILGSLTAGMTNPPGLQAVSAQIDSELPVMSYASLYPLALIFKIIVVQLLVQFLYLV